MSAFPSESALEGRVHFAETVAIDPPLTLSVWACGPEEPQTLGGAEAGRHGLLQEGMRPQPFADQR